MKTIKKSWRAIVLGFVAVTIGGFRNKAWSEDVSPAQSVEQRLAILERKQELLEEEAAAKAKTGVKTTLSEGGLGLASNDGNFKIKLGGYVQVDYRSYFKDRSTPSQAPNTFLIRRARPTLEATFYRDFALRLVPDFGGGTTVLQDAYGEYKGSPLLGVRIGKFKTPVDIERLQSDLNYLFAETALTGALTPNRDVGAQLQGEVDGGLVQYALGVFNGVPDGGIADTDTHSDKDVAARVFVKPFKNTTSFVQGLGFGVGSSYGKRWGTLTSTQLPSFKTDGQQTFFSYATASTSTGTAVADGINFRLAPQLYFSRYSLGVLAEYVTSDQEVRRANVRRRFTNTAWQTAVTYVLTGENATLNGVTPAKPFDPKLHQWGAWEIGARYASLDVDDDIFAFGNASLATSATRAQAYTAGVSWYLNRSVRAYVDYTLTRFTSGASNNRDRENENVLITRVQFVF